MRILVLHAWLKGNVGDVLQLSVLLRGLRELGPRVLDLAGFPAVPGDESREVLASADRYLADPFAWYWNAVPRPARRILLEPRYRAGRKALFSGYDAIVCAPGPYLADYDARAPSAWCDIAVASELGLPIVLASHSIGPLSPPALAVLAKATVLIAREQSTHEYLRQRGIASSLAADLAFLYAFAVHGGPAPIEPPYRLVFLRSNNLDAAALRLDGGALLEGGRVIAEASKDRLVLATSDYPRDRRFLVNAARRLGVSWVGCRSVPELVRLVRGSTGVVSDRYHPAICAAALGKPAQVLSNREPHKMQGLSRLLAGHSLDKLQRMARTGLDSVLDALRALKGPDDVAPAAPKAGLS